MHPGDLSTLLGLAVSHHRAGRFQEAEGLYRACLSRDPEHVDALHLLGVTLRQRGRAAEAEPLIRGAICRCKCPTAELFNNLGNALRDLGRHAESVEAFRRAVELMPSNPICQKNLADACLSAGDFVAAVAGYARALELGVCDAEVHNNLGVLLERQGRACDSRLQYEAAIRLRADWADPHNNLGNVLRTLGDPVAAESEYQTALALDPSAAACVNLGMLSMDNGRYRNAKVCFNRAVTLAPALAAAHSGLAGVLRLSGESCASAEAYQYAVDLEPGNAAIHSSLLQTYNLVGDKSNTEVLHAHVEWANCHAAGVIRMSPPVEHDLDPERRLRLGYVSGDFHSHAVTRCFRGILQHHDMSRFHVTCFSNCAGHDGATDELIGLSSAWHQVEAKTDDAVAELVRRNNIDILVDLSGHSSRNRLLAFARKPAPIQVSYFGYQDTTGLAAMDYRITDADADPPGETEHLHVEELIRLPRACWCYMPTGAEPSIAEPPSATNGVITFGCLNDLSKVSEQIVDIWGALLTRLSSSKLLLLGSAAAEGGEQIISRLNSGGVDRSRIEVLRRGTWLDYMAYYQRIDIALDSFPYTGCTTTADALYMGVPVVTMAGTKYVSRQGIGLLKSVGLAGLITADAGAYIKAAIQLAADRPRLTRLRWELRERMHASPLLDPKNLARALEHAYREMWKQFVVHRSVCRV